MADYVKAADLDFVEQLNNFKAKLPSYKTTLGLSDPTLEQAKADAEYMAFAVLSANAANTYKQGWTDLKRDTRYGQAGTPTPEFPVAVDVSSPPVAVAPGVEDRFRALVAQIKVNPSYTRTMGEDLGIVANESTTEPTKPALTLKLEGGNPVISFKKGSTDGVRIESKRGAEADFSFLAIDTRSPYVDNRPNLVPGTPETRQYRAYFIVNDQQVGQQSDPASINV